MVFLVYANMQYHDRIVVTMMGSENKNDENKENIWKLLKMLPIKCWLTVVCSSWESFVFVKFSFSQLIILRSFFSISWQWMWDEYRSHCGHLYFMFYWDYIDIQFSKISEISGYFKLKNTDSWCSTEMLPILIFSYDDSI